MSKNKSYRDNLSPSVMLGVAAAALAILAWAPSAAAEETAKPICADRPNKAVSPCTVDAGHWQVEVDVADFTHDKTAGVTSEMGVWGAPNIKYGVTDKLDLELNIASYETLRSA